MDTEEDAKQFIKLYYKSKNHPSKIRLYKKYVEEKNDENEMQVANDENYQKFLEVKNKLKASNPNWFNDFLNI